MTAPHNPANILVLTPVATNQERYGVPISETDGATVTLTYHCDKCRSVTCEHIQAVKAFRDATAR